jgi:hypothetical protein
MGYRRRAAHIRGSLSALYLTGHKRGMLVIGVGVTAILLWAQIRMISAAITGGNRIPAGLYWAVLVCIAAGMVLAVEVIH